MNIKKKKEHFLRLGAHMSIAGGLENAIKSGEQIGCTAIAMFVKSNRQWGSKRLTKEEIKIFKETWENSCVVDIVVHASYLTNIGSPERVTYNRSVASLVNELQICQQLGIEYLVLHPGSHLGSGEEECIKQIMGALDEIIEQVEKKDFDSEPGQIKTKILIETMAGQGSGVGHTFEQVANIISLSKHKKRLGVCLDTCHIFAAGYDIRTKKEYEKVIQEFDDIIGLKNLYAMHINDSKKDLGSKVDRHEEIGEGLLGLEPFGFIFNDERFFDIPKILETPEGTLSSYAKNMKLIKGLLIDKTRKLLGE